MLFVKFRTSKCEDGAIVSLRCASVIKEIELKTRVCELYCTYLSVNHFNIFQIRPLK